MRTEFQSKGISVQVVLSAGQSIVIKNNPDRTMLRMRSSDAGAFNFIVGMGDTLSGTIAQIDDLVSHPAVTSSIQIVTPGAITVDFVVSHQEDITVV